MGSYVDIPQPPSWASITKPCGIDWPDKLSAAIICHHPACVWQTYALIPLNKSGSGNQMTKAFKDSM